VTANQVVTSLNITISTLKEVAKSNENFAQVEGCQVQGHLHLVPEEPQGQYKAT
jgi:hypothetical protein